MAVGSLANKWTVVVVLMVIVTNLVEPMAGKVNLSGQRNQEIEIRLKQLNKKPLKSIESSSGEIIDCISILKQPAFDHPMLKNHTIQMRPSSYPREVLNEDDKASVLSNDEGEQDIDIAQTWQLAGECPEKTIPIKRVTKEDLLRVDDINNFGKKVSRSNISQPHQFHHPTAIYGDNRLEYAITYVNNGIFRGAKANINLWKPRVQEDGEFSISQIWVLGGKFGPDLNSIEVGSHVNPDLYGDANSRFFIYWTNSGYQKGGCYNLLCSGFVQTNKKITIGSPFKPISTYKGQQYQLIVQIWKDPKTENWWLQLNDKYLIGYWPSELFPNFAGGATTIEWGGEVMNKKTYGKHTTTQMGSGHFSSEGFGKAGHFKLVKIIDVNDVIIDPVGIQTLVSRPTCYDLKTGSSKSWGVFFYYGGPGRNSNCP